MGNWFMTPHEIYQALTTGPGSDKVDMAQSAAKILWKDESERADLIRRQGELIRSAWQGSASDGAFGAAQPLAASALNRVDELARAEDLLDRQSGSFNRAKNEVRPVPPEPPGIDLTDPMVVFTDYEKQVVAYQADAHHNIDVFEGYDNASNYNETNIPARYSTVNGSGGTISVTADGAQPSDTGDYIEVPDREQPRSGGDSGPYDRYSGYGGYGPGGSPVSGPPPVSGPVPNPSLPQQTTPSTYVPPSVNPPGQLPPNPYQPTPVPTQPGYGPSLPVGGVTGGPPGPGPRSGYGPGGGGYGPRGGSYGPGNPGNPGPGARGPVPGPGPATGAIAAEEAAARRAAAAAATGRGTGPGGMAGAPMGSGRGKGDEDEEHQRKVLIETDGETIFGSDVLTAPQVIGDDEYEDD